MSFQGYQGKVNPQVGHEIPGAKEGAHMMQLSQEQLTQMVTSAMTQALTQHMQQTGSNPPLAITTSHVTQNTATEQQVLSPTKFGIPTFEGDSAASCLTVSQIVVHQAKACGFAD